MKSEERGPEIRRLQKYAILRSAGQGWAAARAFQRRHQRLVAVSAAALITAIVVFALWGKRHELAHAAESAPAWLLLCAIALQVVAVLTRTEAWRICVLAAGGNVPRRRLYRAASVGYVGSLVSVQLASAARIAALRRSAPRDSPRIAPLLTAELPIMVVEGLLAAIASVTLVGPLGLPWWSPLVALAGALAVSSGLRSLALGTGRGLRRGLNVMRGLNGSVRVVSLILVATFAQIGRNWLMLHAVGVDVSVFDATAVLIAQVTLALLPLGPSTGAAATVLILGPHGVAAVAAAGVLLTATGTVGGLLFAGWALGDRLWCGERGQALRHRLVSAVNRPARQTALRLRSALAALPEQQRRVVEVAYFGGLSQLQIARALGV